MEEEGLQVIPWNRRQRDESPLGYTLGRRREEEEKERRLCGSGISVKGCMSTLKVEKGFCNGHMYKLNRWEVNSPLIKWIYHRSFVPKHRNKR